MTLSKLDGADEAVPGWCMDGRGDEVLVVPGLIIAPSRLIIGDNTSGL